MMRVHHNLGSTSEHGNHNEMNRHEKAILRESSCIYAVNIKIY
jgi:hypothetical protein